MAKSDNLDRKIHWTVFIEGPDADKISIVDFFDKYCDGLDAKITSANATVYYTEKKTTPSK